MSTPGQKNDFSYLNILNLIDMRRRGSSAVDEESEPTALFDACMHHDYDVVCKLLILGASPCYNYGSDTPFTVVARNPRSDVLGLMIERMSSVDMESVPKHLMFSVVKYLILQNQIKTLSKIDIKILELMDWRTGETFLHIAAEVGNLQVVELLRSKGVSIYVADEGGNLPIHCAAAENHVHLLEWFFRADNTLVNATNAYGWTLAHLTIQNHSIKSLKCLVRHVDNVLDIVDQLRSEYSQSAYSQRLAAYDLKSDNTEHSILMGMLDELDTLGL